MFGSVMLDVGIGLILVYLILSLACTALREGIEALLRDRSTFLHRGVCELLHDGALTKDLYEHPLISALYRDTYENAKGSKDLPSYIPSRSFALAVLDMAARGRDTTHAASAGAGATPLSVAALRQNVAQIGNPKVQRVLLSAIDLSNGEITKVQDALETWFNSSMDRVSGWYKRRSQWILIGLGIAISVIANVDTIRLAVAFYKDPAQRQAAVAMAGAVAKEPPQGTTRGQSATSADVTTMLVRLDSLSLPIGWRNPQFNALTLLGWLLTGLAISMGAPFWFDLLGKFMTVRTSLKPDAPKAKSDGDQGPDGNSSAAAPRAPATAGAGAAGPAQAPGADYRPHEWSSGHPETGVL